MTSSIFNTRTNFAQSTKAVYQPYQEDSFTKPINNPVRNSSSQRSDTSKTRDEYTRLVERVMSGEQLSHRSKHLNKTSECCHGYDKENFDNLDVLASLSPLNKAIPVATVNLNPKRDPSQDNYSTKINCSEGMSSILQ